MMLAASWGATLPRTMRFEVDALGNIIGNVPKTQTRRKRVVREENYLLLSHDDEEWSEEKENSKKKRASAEASGYKRKKMKGDVPIVIDGPQPPPPMPQEFKKRILELFGENSAITEELVMQKVVETSDIDKGKNRLSIPAGKMLCNFLNEDEEKQLRKKSPMRCKMIEPNLALGEVKLSDWKIFYALNGGWNEVKARNTIVPKLIVQLWAVRVDGVLLFVLVDITTPEERSRLVEEAAASGILPYKK